MGFLGLTVKPLGSLIALIFVTVVFRIEFKKLLGFLGFWLVVQALYYTSILPIVIWYICNGGMVLVLVLIAIYESKS